VPSEQPENQPLPKGTAVDDGEGAESAEQGSQAKTDWAAGPTAARAGSAESSDADADDGPELEVAEESDA
jgi:midasin (ATPase involved in ribosome maturation)